MIKKRLPVLFILLIIIVITFNIINQPMYGNSEDMIRKSIKSIDLFQDDNIDILSIYDIGEHRVVTFLGNQEPSIITFKKNSNGDYEKSYSEKKVNDEIAQFVLFELSNDDEVYVFHVRRKTSDTEAFTFKVNETIYDVRFNMDSPFSQFTILDKSEDDTYEFDWMNIEEK